MSRILQIGYDKSVLQTTNELLKSGRYTVVTVRGNTRAARISCSDRSFSLVILGQTTHPWKRRALAGWLKLEQPAIPVMALHTEKGATIQIGRASCRERVCVPV